MNLTPVTWNPLVAPAWAIGLGGLLIVLLVLRAATRREGRPLLLGRAVMVALLVGILLGPGLGAVAVQAARPADLQVLTVIDRTVSMSAMDGPAGSPRLELARSDLETAVLKHPGARFALLEWGTRAELTVPFTSDRDAFLRAVALVEREDPVEGIGSRLDRPLARMGRVLEAARKQYPERHTVVLFLSDGENTRPGRQASYAPLADVVDAGLVVGYGTETGGRMLLEEKRPGIFVPGDRSGTPAVSRVDEQNLRRIADELGIGFADRGSNGPADAGVEALVRALDPPVDLVLGSAVVAHEVTWLLALLLLVVALLELRRSWRAWHEARRAGGRR